ncbi:hypothetical protein PG993_003740 [Apiospora rasikravindrae]|uniref:Mucoidy inhibitor-like protein n=1 Tax=Apiospora rasikravindrae TaxID=990691 RepID=A0ABR1U2Q0_9PEZI
MDVTHKQEYRIRELETRSVTLFPGRAQVHRQVKDVPLKAGENQITIVGLTPTVDQDSIKVEGTGSAIITDMAVELLPNREIFEEVYPEYDDDGDSSDSDSDPDSSSEGEDEEERANAAMGDIRGRIRLAEDDEKRAGEIVTSAKRRLEILDSYGKLMTTDRQNTAAPDVKIDEGLATYRAEREKIFADIWDGNVQHREVKDKLQRLRKEEGRMVKQYRRETAKADKLKRKEAKAKQKEQQKAARKQQEIRREQARVRKERESFWPKKVYSIRITLDATAFTPGSSRRNSIASDVEVMSPKSPEKSSDNEPSGSTCDLSISYVTTDAYWSPAYDMALSTTANTGHVCFDAQLTNRTAETWSNCKITLSTPQADFSGLHDTIPTLVPWRVRLTGGRAAHGDAYSSNSIMFSRDEQSHRAAWADKQTGRSHAQQPRAELFGVVKSQAKSSRGGAARFLMSAASDESKEEECEEEGGSDEEMGFGLFDGGEEPQRRSVNEGIIRHSTFSAAPRAAPSSMPGAPPPPAGSFRPNVELASRATSSAASKAKKSKSVFPSTASFISMPRMRNSNSTSTGGGGYGGAPPQPAPQLYDPSTSSFMEEQQTITEQPAELAFQESTFEETGFTTTYDLPGLKTLAPASTASKQRVARITFANIAFSHTVVAKYKPVAYLQAKVRNGNKLTLLPGPAGLTLDGSFLGRTHMPRCSPGDSFTLSLGVDPAIKVAYPKPDVRRSQSGVFNREDSAVYTRTISLSNTRSSPSSATSSSSGTSQQKQPLPARITVLDQVPVSEDERLRVEVLQPRGLTLAGSPGVPAGVAGREGKDEMHWGKAVATLKKGGEVSWDVTLNAGRMVKLGLEYQCAFPTGDQAVNV